MTHFHFFFSSDFERKWICLHGSCCLADKQVYFKKNWRLFLVIFTPVTFQLPVFVRLSFSHFLNSVKPNNGKNVTNPSPLNQATREEFYFYFPTCDFLASRTREYFYRLWIHPFFLPSDNKIKPFSVWSLTNHKMSFKGVALMPRYARIIHDLKTPG